jgi:hypothetical protein
MEGAAHLMLVLAEVLVWRALERSRDLLLLIRIPERYAHKAELALRLHADKGRRHRVKSGSGLKIPAGVVQLGYPVAAPRSCRACSSWPAR